MQIEIEVSGLATGEIEPRYIKFNSFGVGALETLRAIANGLQTRALVQVTIDSVIVMQRDTGRKFIDWGHTMEAK